MSDEPNSTSGNWNKIAGLVPGLLNEVRPGVVVAEALYGIWDLTFVAGGTGELSLDAQGFSYVMSNQQGHWGVWTFSANIGGYPTICTQRRGSCPSRVHGLDGRQIENPSAENWQITSYSGDSLQFATCSAIRRGIVPMPIVSAHILQVQTNLALADAIDMNLAALAQGHAMPAAAPHDLFPAGAPKLAAIAMRSANVIFAVNQIDQELSAELARWRYQFPRVDFIRDFAAELARQNQCNANVAGAYRQAISRLEAWVPEATTLLGFGSAKPNDFLQQRRQDYQGALAVVSGPAQSVPVPGNAKLAPENASVMEQMREIERKTNAAILESMQRINTGWQGAFDKSNAAVNGYLRR
jgi:hypothetical protein